MNQIFLSSVQKELAVEREAIRDFIRQDALFRDFFSVFLFEDLPSSDQTPDGLYLTQVSASAIYLGIFGNEYGSEDLQGISPTEREFHKATADSIYRLVFIKGTDDSKRHPKMHALVGKASRQLTRRRFDTVDELLHQRVYPSLIGYLKWKGILRGTITELEPLPDLTIDDLHEEKLLWFLAKAQEARGYRFGPTTPTMDALTHLDLLNESRITHAALLLFGKRPQIPLPSSEVKCLHFHGTEAVKPIPDYQIFKGNIFGLIDQAVDYVMAKLARRVGVRDAGPDNTVSYEIPRAAVSEIIVNAIAHRDYQSDASVQIYVFSDRVEVWNPGKPHPPSPPRNSVIPTPPFRATSASVKRSSLPTTSTRLALAPLMSSPNAVRPDSPSQSSAKMATNSSSASGGTGSLQPSWTNSASMNGSEWRSHSSGKTGESITPNSGNSPESVLPPRRGIWMNLRNQASLKFLVVGAPPPTGLALIGSYSGQSGHRDSSLTHRKLLKPVT